MRAFRVLLLTLLLLGTLLHPMTLSMAVWAAPSRQNATVPFTAGQVTTRANLRAGPGTSYPVVGGASAGQRVEITGCNQDCSWLQISPNTWISAALVQPHRSAPANGVVLEAIFYDGVVATVESDEYALVANRGVTVVNLAGWRLNAGADGQDFRFPNLQLAPGQSCRIYTNERHAESCGLSFAITSAIWNNQGDCGYLHDAAGVLASSFCYGSQSSQVPVRTTTTAAVSAVAPAPSPTAVLPQPTPAPLPTATPQPSPATTGNCDPSYPTVCIPPGPPDLDCGEIAFRRFAVVGADPHRFDGDNDGIGCES